MGAVGFAKAVKVADGLCNGRVNIHKILLVLHSIITYMQDDIQAGNAMISSIGWAALTK